MHSDRDLTARARIRDAALARFGAEGINRVTVREIAAEAGVSPALVIHHFGSKEGLRQACDAYVVSLIRDSNTTLEDTAGLAAALDAAIPVRRYLARAFLDGSPAAAALFDEIVALTGAWLADGEREGSVQASADPQARAAIYVIWLLAPLVFSEHLSRVLGIDDPHETEATLRYSRAALEMLTHGVFTDERTLRAWDAVKSDRPAR